MTRLLTSYARFCSNPRNMRIVAAAIFVAGMVALCFVKPAHSQTISPPKGADLIDSGTYSPALTDCALWAITNLKRHPGSHLVVIIAPIQNVTSYAVRLGDTIYHDNEPPYRVQDVRVIEEETADGWQIVE